MPAAIADPSCPDCGGTGWIRVDDAGAGAARPCDCRRARLGPALVEASGIPPRYLDCTIQNFRTSSSRARVDPILAEAKATCQSYVDQFLSVDGEFAETGLLLIGPPGTGKTHLAAAVLAELVRTFKLRGRFVDFTSLVHRIQSTFDPASAESKHDVLDPVIEAQLLVIDELGAQKPTPFVNDTLYLILNTRYIRKLPTLFTTNFRLGRAAPGGGSELDLLSSRIPALLVSRLHQMAKPVLLDAEDFRETVVALARDGGRAAG